MLANPVVVTTLQKAEQRAQVHRRRLASWQRLARSWCSPASHAQDPIACYLTTLPECTRQCPVPKRLHSCTSNHPNHLIRNRDNCVLVDQSRLFLTCCLGKRSHLGPARGAQRNKLILIMVGLPGRGKTFLCNKLKCYLNWWVPCLHCLLPYSQLQRMLCSPRLLGTGIPLSHKH